MEGLSKSPAVFDYEKLRWFNSEYIKKMSVESYEAKAMPILSSLCPDFINIKKLATLLHTRIATFDEIKDQIGFVCTRLPMESDLYTNKKNKTTPQICKAILEEVLPVLESIDNWCNDYLFEQLKEFSENTERKAGAVMWAVRIAVARLGVTPGGATELMEVLGKEESIQRIKQAIEEL